MNYQQIILKLTNLKSKQSNTHYQLANINLQQLINKSKKQ
jgi:hypothetical protein